MTGGLIFSEDCPRVDWLEAEFFQEEFGVKGAMSLTLPHAWTPPYVLISSTLTSSLSAGAPLSSLISKRQISRIRKLAGTDNQLIVRSSIVGESIWERGTYESVTISRTVDGFVGVLDAAAQKVTDSAPSKRVGLLVQRYVAASARGEFGNLQRISKTRDQWEVSTTDRAGSMTRQRLNSQRDQAADPEAPLLVRSGVSTERLFGSIGAWLNNELLRGRSQRLNCEWLTDNRQFYIVQVDEEDEDVWGVNPFQIRVSASFRPEAKSGRYFKLAEGGALLAWDKLRVLEELWEPSATHKPILFYVPLNELPNKDDETGLGALETDFGNLIGPSGIVVRTSVAAGEEKIPNLPRTECLGPAQAAEWCLATAAELKDEHEVGQLAFVAHRFVAARGSAWARAEPGNAIVEIHALWGLPDALQYCPYDIWEVHLPTGVATDYPDYKSDMLIPKPDGSWEHARVKNELARHNSMSSTEARDIATRTSAIADRLGRACHIMWFVGCIDEEGVSFNLPWYWTEAHPAERNHDRATYRLFTVSDVRSLQKFREWEGPRNRQALALRPTDLELMRDTEFIQAVGNAATDASVPVILSGSTLAHAYYQLRKLGCAVVTPGEKEHSRIRRTANLGKLVRDKIPAKIAQRQELEVTRRVPANLMKGFLISKLLEEALEVRGANGPAQKTEELADLFEVFRAMAKAEGISVKVISATANRKKAKAGGFEEGLVLLQTGIASSGRGYPLDPDRVPGQVLADKTSDDTVEVPFSFFGFMELDQPRSMLFEHLGIRLDVLLRSDRIELRLLRGSEQLGLPLDQALTSVEEPPEK